MVAAIQQFDVCPNLGANKSAVPFLLVIQHDVAKVLDTRLVVPLVEVGSHRPLERAAPVVVIADNRFVAVFAQMRALPLYDLGPPVVSLDEHHLAFIQAYDFLISGF